MELYKLIQLCKLKSTMSHMFQSKIVLLNTQFSDKSVLFGVYHFLH